MVGDVVFVLLVFALCVLLRLLVCCFVLCWLCVAVVRVGGVVLRVVVVCGCGCMRVWLRAVVLCVV